MTTFRLALAHISTMAEFHDRVVEGLRFPAYYGRNLDAFWDCISEIGPDDLVEIVNIDKVDKTISDQVARYVEIIREASERDGRGFAIELL